MKKKYLTYAGIVSAVILVIMFAIIFLTGSFSIFSSATIDPIPDHAAGDLVVITGTTNLMAGTRLELDIAAVSPAPGMNPLVGDTDAFIVRGGGLSNTWSGALDTSAIPPGEYQVNAYSVNDTNSRGDLLATSRLRLTGEKPSPAGSPGTVTDEPTFITVNPPGMVWSGEKLLVTGTTNLPEDTELLYLVIQQSNISVFTVEPKTGKEVVREGLTRTGLIDVMPGTGGVNRWSFAVDSTEFIPSDYLVIVTLETINPNKIGIEGPFGVAPLTIKESTPGSLTSPVQNDSPCRAITIDAFPAQWINRTYTITGTTTFPPGTELLVQIYPTEYDLAMNMGTEYPEGSMSGAEGTVIVEKGNGNVNLWSFMLNMGRMDPDPRKYLVNISNDQIDNRTYATIEGGSWCSERLLPQIWG
jgi:hypothetical protein